MREEIREKNLDILEQHFRDGCKPNCVQRLGVELEHIVLHRKTGLSLTYYEEGGIESLLQELREHFPHSYCVEGRLLGLYNDDYSISLEPAGQLEISIAPRESLDAIRKIYQSFLHLLHPFLESRDCCLATLGYQPISRVDQLPLIPKKRYEFMDHYFQTSGSCGRHMMRGTASTQISIDYCSEEDFRSKYRAACLLMPALKLLTDNCPVFEGQPYKGHLARTYIWNHVDPIRCGILPGLFRPDFGFRSYARYLWQLPPIFRPTARGPIYTGQKTAGELWQDQLLTPEDVDHLLSMTFLDVRLKHYLEIRGADSMPFDYVMAYLALIKGLFFHPPALEEILEKYSSGEQKILSTKREIRDTEHGISYTEQKIRDTEQELMKKGWAGEIYGQPAIEFLQGLLDLAEEQLEGEEKCCLLPFRTLLWEGKGLAEHKESNIHGC